MFERASDCECVRAGVVRPIGLLDGEGERREEREEQEAQGGIFGGIRVSDRRTWEGLTGPPTVSSIATSDLVVCKFLGTSVPIWDGMRVALCNPCTRIYDTSYLC